MNGIYRAEFTSPLGSGAGTVYLDGNTFRGGDHVVAYFGSCSVENGVLKAEMTLIKHGNGSSILGDAKNALIQGKVDGDIVTAQVIVPDVAITAQVRLCKIANF